MNDVRPAMQQIIDHVTEQLDGNFVYVESNNKERSIAGLLDKKPLTKKVKERLISHRDNVAEQLRSLEVR